MFSSTTGCTLTEMPAGPMGRLSGAIAHYIQARAHSYDRERSPSARVCTSLPPKRQEFRGGLASLLRWCLRHWGAWPPATLKIMVCRPRGWVGRPESQESARRAGGLSTYRGPEVAQPWRPRS